MGYPAIWFRTMLASAVQTGQLILGLVVLGTIAAWQIRELLAESPWYGVLMLAALVFVAVLHHLFQ